MPRSPLPLVARRVGCGLCALDHQGPGQIDRLWILDIDGHRLVIDAFSMPYATPEEIEELVAVVESIRFGP